MAPSDHSDPRAVPVDSDRAGLAAQRLAIGLHARQDAVSAAPENWLWHRLRDRQVLRRTRRRRWWSKVARPYICRLSAFDSGDVKEAIQLGFRGPAVGLAGGQLQRGHGEHRSDRVLDPGDAHQLTQSVFEKVRRVCVITPAAASTVNRWHGAGATRT
jgi:hypothetical protein